MGEGTILGMVGMLGIFVMGVLFYLHARGEANRALQLVESVTVTLQARNATDAADSLGHLRQAQSYAKTLDRPQPEPPAERVQHVGPGSDYEMIGE